MSHIRGLRLAQEHCDTTGECTEYQALLQHENARIDANTTQAIQGVVTTGLIIAVIGLVFMITPLVKSLRRFQAFLLPKLAIATPVLVGLAGGAWIGFVISFSSCFKQPCSDVERWALLIVPPLTLILTLPLAALISKARFAMRDRIANFKPLTWIVLGLLIIGLAVTYTVHRVGEVKQGGEQGKQYLLRSKP